MQRQTIDFCDVAKAKQAAREALIPAEWRLEPEQLHRLSHAPIEALEASGGLLTPRELLITSSSAQDLLSHLHATAQEERWTAVEVTRAFCKRASLAHQLTNCLTEIFFDDALRRAAELDAYMAQHGQPAGPLAGLPISLKDCFNVGGYDSTLGFVAWANDAQPADSALVGILRRAGAVLYCKTNVPTAMMIAESVNNVWGRTFSPHNITMTSGGSSGGESALLAMRGSPLGVGTDIGGSIRIPAALCGLYGLKPSFGRFPTFGARSGMAGQESINSINGPMSADLESLGIFARAVVGAEPWRIDPKCVPLPWRSVSDLPSTGLVFGVLFDDGRVHPTPPVTRALHVVVDALKAQGHTVIEWESKEELSFAHDLTQQFFTADGREGISGIMEHGGEADKWIEGLGPVVQKKSIHELWQVQAVSCRLYFGHASTSIADKNLAETDAVGSESAAALAEHQGPQWTGDGCSPVARYATRRRRKWQVRQTRRECLLFCAYLLRAAFEC